MIEINTNRIHETVRLVAGNDRLELDINLDPMIVMGGVNDVLETMKATDEKDSAGILKCARDFAILLLGADQADAFIKFYGGDGTAALSAVSRIFNEAVMPKLTAAQESGGRKSVRRKLKEILRRHS